MKTFTVTHTETLVKEVFVEANTKEEAYEKYWKMLSNGEIDFSDEELIDSSDVILESEED